MAHPLWSVRSDAPALYYWHYLCPSRDCTAPVVRGDAGFTPDQAKALRAATTPPTLRCKSCGASMTGYLQIQKRE